MKRAFDVVASCIAIVLLSPLLILVSALVLMLIGRPIFFRQTRPGLNGKPFEMLKFRSMTDAVDVDGNPLSDRERLTKFGMLLRSSSLDEIPEFLNVLRGEMSLVGPRPLLMQYLPLYTKEQARRNEVRPGITGWAQINGRNALSWEQKFLLDVWYIDNWSFTLDLRILFATVGKVIKRSGIRQEGDATMPVFLGNQQKDKS